VTIEERAAANERKLARRREIRRERRAAGLCTECGKAVKPGNSKCEHCLSVHRAKEHPPKPEHDPDALTRDVHKLELLNRERRRAGLPALSYGQWRARG
jgi:hypothetical protein